MTLQIDQSSYNKAIRYPQRHGYQIRGTAPTSIVIHTTNGRPGTTFAAEADYLYTSADVSAHFLIGKDGQVAQFLDPKLHQAWHAGAALADWVNARSIGIECHHAVGEDWPDAQFAALTALTRQLIARFSIAEKLIETHRAVALPHGRKVDPSDWRDRDFYAWRAMLYATPADPFARWGDIGKPEGAATGWAIPRMWLDNQWLGRCLMAETWWVPDVCSAACFEHGCIVYDKSVDAARLVRFGGWG